MINRMIRALSVLLLCVSFTAAAAEEGGAVLQQAGNSLQDKGSLQRGAGLYMNYCAACHSLKYMRYSRIAKDLDLSEEQVMGNLNFSGAKFGEQIHVAMPDEQATRWFGKMPPDLSVISRVRGSDWIYSYLKSFYLDESRPLGWNNTVFPNASMPNPFWELQGLQHPEFGPKQPTGETGDDGKPLLACAHGAVEADDRCIQTLVLPQPGQQTAAEFDQTVRDVTNFLEYVGEPAALKRQSIGVWVILFLALLTFLAWLLKQEYWRDVH